jgi:hypothetical protein
LIDKNSDGVSDLKMMEGFTCWLMRIRAMSFLTRNSLNAPSIDSTEVSLDQESKLESTTMKFLLAAESKVEEFGACEVLPLPRFPG